LSIDAPPHPEPPPPAPVPPRGRGPIVLIVVAAIVIAAVGVVAFVTGGDDGEGASGDPQQVVSYGRPVEPAVPRPSFTLTGTDGLPYDFAAETSGQLTFLFFGYTNCPDICPISMATLTAALDELDGIGAKVVFVTTDPSRDTPERLTSWLTNYPVEVVGLTGSLADLEGAQREAGVTAAIAEAPDDDGNYEVGHSAAMLVYTPDDLQHLSYGAGTTQSEWMADIPKIAAERSWNTAARGVLVTDAYAGPSASGAAAVYLTVTDGAEGDRLIAASSPDASEVTIHVSDGSVMRSTDGIDVPADGAVSLEPGGAHVMLEDLGSELAPGDTITVVLQFERSGAVSVEVPVVSYDELASRVGG